MSSCGKKSAPGMREPLCRCLELLRKAQHPAVNRVAAPPARIRVIPFPQTCTTPRGNWARFLSLPRWPRSAVAIKRIVVVSFGMSAEFLAALAGERRTAVTVLRTDQYSSIQSFREVGEFAPLQTDRQGKMIREVAL